MIHIYHGDQTTASRQELSELKAKFSAQEVITLDGKTVSLTELTQATESTSLFNDKRLVIVENFLSRRLTKKSSEAKVIEKWLTSIPPETELVFWEDKEIGKTILSLFPSKTDRAVFKMDRSLFKLVEAIRPGKTLELVNTLNESLLHDPADFGKRTGNLFTNYLINKKEYVYGYFNIQGLRHSRHLSQSNKWPGCGGGGTCHSSKISTKNRGYLSRHASFRKRIT